MIKICVFIAISCINICENEADNTTVSSVPTIPILDFWSPDPKFFESRRKMQDATKENKIYYRHGRGKTNVKSKRGRHDGDQSKKPPESPALRTRDEETSIWPRARHGQHKERTGTEHGLSTRMTPIYLMQQPNEGEPSEVTTAKESTTPAANWADGYMSGDLSPYVLEGQIREILSSYPDVNASIEVIGRTVEYNNILLVKLSEHNTEIGKYFRAEDSKYIEEVPEKKIVFIVYGLSVMGIHAPYGSRLFPLSDIQSFVMLLHYYIRHLDKFDIFLMPMANPDGYLATKEKPYWNKNMSPQSACAGVALDRNFDVAWNTAKVYSSCSQLYPGPAPFSEVETKAVRDVLHHYGHKIIAYIHVHAGSPTDTVFKGEAVLYPKGFTEIQSDDDKYIDLRGEIDEMMKNASFQVMTVAVETLHNWYGKVSGSSVDYASTVYGIPYALEFVMQIYKFELVPFEEQVSVHALTVIWQRIIDIFFHNIWINLHANDVK